MKLIGKVNSIERTVAKANKDGSFDEKRRFSISARPATPLSSSHYGYGGLNFILHGQELSDFGVDLSDEVEIFVTKKGGEFDRRQIEDVSHALYEAQGQITIAENTIASLRDNAKRHEIGATTLREQNQALRLENVRLATQIETLKAMGYAPADGMKQIEQ